jgi:enterochelin esterase-like enzyme
MGYDSNLVEKSMISRYGALIQKGLSLWACPLLLALFSASCAGMHSDSGPVPVKASLSPNPTATQSVSLSSTSLPTASSTPEQECNQRGGELLRTEFTDPIMTAFRIPVNIYLPPCYRVRADRYPVVYLLHGYPRDQDHWLELGLQAELDSYITSGAWPEIIVVMPFQPEPYFTHTDGGPGTLEQVIIEGLVPYIDANFRTIPSAQERALAGISRGGVWALEIGLRAPQVFDNVAALSPALTVNHPRTEYDPSQIVHRSESLPGRIWLSVGDSEPSFQLGIDRFAAVLDERGIPYTYIHSSGRHEDAAWIPLIEPLFEFLLAPSPESKP